MVPNRSLFAGTGRSRASLAALLTSCESGEEAAAKVRKVCCDADSCALLRSALCAPSSFYLHLKKKKVLFRPVLPPSPWRCAAVRMKLSAASHLICTLNLTDKRNPKNVSSRNLIHMGRHAIREAGAEPSRPVPSPQRLALFVHPGWTLVC